MKYLSLLSILFLLPIACGESEDNNDSDAEVIQPDTNAGIDLPDVLEEEDADVSLPTDGPLVIVPPEAWDPDPAESCPEAFATESLTAGQHENFGVGTQIRSFYLAIPDPTEHAGPRPVLLSFNGTGGTGQGAFGSYGLQGFVDAGFITIGPDSQGNGSIWPSWDAMHQQNEEEYPNPDLDFFDDLLPCVAAHLEVDKNRIYITGHSAGGIMTNYVLQRRSDLLAGGIVASGILDFTLPSAEAELEPMAVAVVWGGDNDEYSGNSEDENVNVPKVNFVEQAALASKLYANAEGVQQIWCRSNDIGHAWNTLLNPYLIDFLLAHPKGYANNPNWSFEQVDEATNAACGEDVYAFDSGIDIPCSGEGICFVYCAFSAECAAENATVAPIITEQLMDLGFVGEDDEKCDGCIDACEEDLTAGGAADEAVLSCIIEATETAECGPGVDGAFPYINTMDACCLDALDSAICSRLCDSLQKNEIVLQFFPSCSAWTPEEEEAEGGAEETEDGGEG